MQYLLFATGEEEKLRPLTNSIPAPMCPVLNRPVMTYGVELLARHGAKEILVALLDQGASIEEYLGDGKRWDVTFRYLLQRQPLGTAGTIKRVEQLICDTLLIMPADRLIDLDIDAALAAHRRHGGIATVICNKAGATGAYLFEPEILSMIPAGLAYDCKSELIPALIAAGESVQHYHCTGYWNPLASFADFHRAQQDMLASLTSRALFSDQQPLRYPVGEGSEIAPGIWSGTHTIIHPKAQLTAPLYIGSDCRIGANTEIGPQSVLGTHSIVDEGATVQGSTVLSHTYIGRMVDIQQRIVAQNLLIDQKTSTALAITDRFLLSKVTPRLPRALLRMVIERGIALIVLLLLLPILLLIGLLLWGISGNLPITRHRRVGTKPAAIIQGSTEPTSLQLWQLRTRRDNQRYLPFGQWLEQWEAHRLPELWNVIFGDLALVGVKPLTEEEATKITEEWQKVRYQSPAGFTGLWYVQAQHGDSFESTCMADTYHAATDSAAQALRILRQTPEIWARVAWQRPYARQIAKPSEVRSQPAVQ